MLGQAGTLVALCCYYYYTHAIHIPLLYTHIHVCVNYVLHACMHACNHTCSRGMWSTMGQPGKRLSSQRLAR